MLDDLIEIINSHEFEEYGSIDLAAALIEGDVLSLSFNLFARGPEQDDDQAWEIECIGVQQHQISLGYCQGFMLHEEHVLLWPYMYPTSSVSFYGQVPDPHAVVGALYKRHFELVGRWIPFGRFMNGNPVDMMGGRYGMLAAGPTPLIESYATVLESFGISAGVSEPRPASYMNDPFGSSAEIAVLIFNDESYVVAQKFNATRLEGTM